MSDPLSQPDLSSEEAMRLRDLSGSPLSQERLAQVLSAYAPILAEIARLRALDLRDVHPAVIFEPTAAYRERP